MKLKYKIFNYCINNIITKEHIFLAMNRFYSENLSTLAKGTKLAILFKIMTKKGNIITISPLQIVDNTKKDELKILFDKFLSFSYYKTEVNKIIFVYTFLNPPLAPVQCVLNPPIDYYVNNSLFELYKILPNNRLFMTWGDCFTIHNDINFSVEDDYLNKFVIWIINNEYHVSVYHIDNIICYFKDIYDPNCESNNTFIRIISNIELYYDKGQCYIINSNNLIN